MASRFFQSLSKFRTFSSVACRAPPDSVYSRVRNFIISNKALQGDSQNEPSKVLTKMQKELLAQIEEVDINYQEFKVRKGGHSSKETPNLIPFNQERRVVGCICHEETHHINYLLLYKGLPMRCKCGHWFKLVDFDEYEEARDRYWKRIQSQPENKKLMDELDEAEAELEKLLDASKNMTERSAGAEEMLDKLSIQWNKYKNAYHLIRKKIDEACISDIR